VDRLPALSVKDIRLAGYRGGQCCAPSCGAGGKSGRQLNYIAGNKDVSTLGVLTGCNQKNELTVTCPDTLRPIPGLPGPVSRAELLALLTPGTVAAVVTVLPCPLWAAIRNCGIEKVRRSAAAEEAEAVREAAATLKDVIRRTGIADAYQVLN